MQPNGVAHPLISGSARLPPSATVLPDDSHGFRMVCAGLLAVAAHGVLLTAWSPTGSAVIEISNPSLTIAFAAKTLPSMTAMPAVPPPLQPIDMPATPRRTAALPPSATVAPIMPVAPAPAPRRVAALPDDRPAMQSEAETATTASTLPAQAASAAATESEPSVRVTRDARFLTSPRPPAYPERAVALGLEGEVIVRAFVAAPGRPGEVIVHESSGHRWLDEAALAAVERWQFAPPLIDGRETAAWVEIPIPFTLR